MDITDLFNDPVIIAKIQKRLPGLFYAAELESSRAGRVGMEVGTIRERILIALLIDYFGEDNINGKLPTHEKEVDAIAMGKPLSIKTTTGAGFGSVKAIWTVDEQQAIRFATDYIPSCDMLLVQIDWNHVGGFFLFQQRAQIETLEAMGREAYLKLPRLGTNPRGVEIRAPALRRLARHPTTCSFPIKWIRTRVEYDPYARWLELWEQE